MNTNYYKYSVLKYTHSPFLGESINIGLLIYFSNNKSFSFFYSKNLSRLKLIYEDVPEKLIKEYLRNVEIKLHSFDTSYDLFFQQEISDLNIFLNKFILPKDGTLLTFSEAKDNEQFDFQNDLIENFLYKKHLIEDIRAANNLPKEPELAAKFYAPLKGLDFTKINSTKERFYKDYTITNETGNEFKFDYAWQNGTLNLIKPISFDLKESKSIADKAYKYLGQFIDLEDEAKNNKLRYDFIVGKPSSKNLFKEYDHALNLLEKVKYSKIILEDDLNSYSKKAISAITEDL